MLTLAEVADRIGIHHMEVYWSMIRAQIPFKRQGKGLKGKVVVSAKALPLIREACKPANILAYYS